MLVHGMLVCIRLIVSDGMVRKTHDYYYVVQCRLLVFVTSNCSHHLVSLRKKQGRVRKILPDGFTSLLVKNSTVPPRGRTMDTGCLAAPG